MALTHLVVQYESNFCSVALQFMEEEKNYPLPPATTGTPSPAPAAAPATTGTPAAWGPCQTVSALSSARSWRKCHILATRTPALSGRPLPRR